MSDAMDRTEHDQKDPCTTLKALRVDFIEYINCTPVVVPAVIAAVATVNPVYDATAAGVDGHWKKYEGLFDDFHYDIGHGKGQGVGEIDFEAPVDGFRNGAPGAGAFGDSETSFGAPTRTWERPRNQF